MKAHTSISLALSSLAFPALTAAAEQKPPNVIVIMTDDQGYADVGFHGQSDIPTPNLDRIAKEGAMFTSAYVTYSVCGPSRAGFITGRYPQRFGFERNPAWRPHDPAVGLPLEERTIADALRPHGYKSGIIGKWHLGSHEKLHPLSRGFDEFYGHLGGGLRYFPDELTIQDYREAKTEPESYRTWIVRDREPVRTEQYLTDEFSREAVEFVRRHKDDPFFLFLSYNAPHGPLQAPEAEIAKFNHIPDKRRRIYCAMVAVLDRGVGEVLDLLDELELTDNTMVFFLSDNGGPTRDNSSSNKPLRGVKSDVWEGGFRVPFAMRWPGVVPEGTSYDHPVSSMDIFATIAAANGIEADAARPLDGVDLVPFLRNGSEGVPHERIYLRKFDAGEFAMREGDFKIVQPRNVETPRLFNLTEDISERKNLAEGNEPRIKSMREAYDAWSSELMEPVFPGLDMREWRQPQPQGRQ